MGIMERGWRMWLWSLMEGFQSRPLSVYWDRTDVTLAASLGAGNAWSDFISHPVEVLDTTTQATSTPEIRTGDFS